MKRIFGVGFAALIAMSAMSSMVSAQEVGATKDRPVNICTGAEAGNYNFVGHALATRLGQASKIFTTIHRTAGSMQNLEKVAKGECDVAFAQHDALHLFKKGNASASKIDIVSPAYEEFVHLLCNKEAIDKFGISKVTKLTDKTTVAVGSEGSGNYVTWQVLRTADGGIYNKVPTSPLAALRAIGKVADGTDVQCMLFTASLGTKLITEDASRYANKLAFVPANDSDLPKIKDNKGRSLYKAATIPGGVYPAFQTGFFTSIDTMSVSALIVANEDFIDANQSVYNAVMRNFPEVMKEQRVRDRLAGKQ